MSVREYGAPIVRSPNGSAHSEQRQRKKRLMAHLGLSSRQWVTLRKETRRHPEMVARWLASGAPFADLNSTAFRLNWWRVSAEARDVKAHLRQREGK